MQFAHPEFLIIGAVVVPLVALLIWRAQNRQRKALGRLGESATIRRLTQSVNWRGRRWQAAFRLVGLALVFVALARPQWGQETQEVQQEGLQVVVALDVSQSMLANDIQPDRLQRARLEIADLTERLNGDELGLVLFSGASFLQVPLTTDYATLLNYLSTANPSVISRPGTVIGEAIRTATEAFDDKLPSQKVLILMTDGEDVETDPLAAAQAAAEEGVLIYTIGFGTPNGSPVPETDAYGRVIGTRVDENGNAAVSRLDEETLKAVAEAGGGRYYRASADGRELDLLLSEIATLQRAELQSRVTIRYIERFQYFLAPALLALVLGELIPERVGDRKRKPKAAPTKSEAGSTSSTGSTGTD